MPKKRKQAKKALRPLLHILCEGEKTEPNYFRWYVNRFIGNKASVKIEDAKTNTPVALVDEARRMKVGAATHDVFWVVFDRESEVKYPEALHDQARQLAAAGDVHIALSNVCFEVWLLLHRRRSCPPCVNCADLLSRKEFKEVFPEYAKGEPIRFTEEEVAHARINAIEMNRRTVAGADASWTVPSKWNPYTTVYQVLDAIDIAAGRIV